MSDRLFEVNKMGQCPVSGQKARHRNECDMSFPMGYVCENSPLFYFGVDYKQELQLARLTCI